MPRRDKTTSKKKLTGREQGVSAAWWLTTRRRRSEWQELTAAGIATFTGRPRAHFEAARPGDPVFLYLSKSDHSIRAVGVVVRSANATPSQSDASGGALPAPDHATVELQLDVQLAFELPNPLHWHEIIASDPLRESEPVRQRSSGTLFSLNRDQYSALQALILSTNPELEAAFSSLDSGAALPEILEQPITGERQLHEPLSPYSVNIDAEVLSSVRNMKQLQEVTGLSCEMLEEARDLLEDVGQIVLSGPPGTGKTWLARGLASLTAGGPERVRLVQFHAATTYEDFIEGLKPVADAWGQVSYAVVPGAFVKLCAEARANPGHYYVMVIDEINRAPLARVFGELLYALEYRGPEGAVQLSASSVEEEPEPFYVPDNLLVIGTMNSADRSLALVDYALRRRFRFIDLEPNAEVLGSWLDRHGTSPAARAVALDLFEAVNARLSADLDPDHRLGHSYFMLEAFDARALDRLWRTAIRPLVAEYFVHPVGELEEYTALFSEAVSRLNTL